MTTVVNRSWRAGCIFLFLFIPFLMARHHFIGNSEDEAPFYLVGLEGCWLAFLLFISKLQNYALSWLEFHFMIHAILEGLII